jgi:hypothetical protein
MVTNFISGNDNRDFFIGNHLVIFLLKFMELYNSLE